MDGSSVSGFWIWKLVQVWELRKWPWVFTEAIVLSLLLLHSCPFLVDVKQHHCCPSVFLYFVLLPISISHPPHTLAQAPIGCLSDFAVLVVIPAFWLLVFKQHHLTVIIWGVPSFRLDITGANPDPWLLLLSVLACISEPLRTSQWHWCPSYQHISYGLGERCFL